jgi:hypothetical protein
MWLSDVKYLLAPLNPHRKRVHILGEEHSQARSHVAGWALNRSLPRAAGVDDMNSRHAVDVYFATGDKKIERDFAEEVTTDVCG